MTADPEDHADGAEDEQDDGRDQKRALPDPPLCRGERRLDAITEQSAVDVFVAISLNRAHFVQRLVDVGADIADAILACARETTHPSSEQDDRCNDERHAGKHQQRQFDARREEHDEAADHQQGIAYRHRR